MTTSLLELSALDKPILWVDYHDYAKKVINQQQSIAWDQTGEVLQFLQQADGLWGSDIVTIDLGDCFEFHLQNNPQLLETMSGKSRLVYALKQFLADQSLIDNVDQILQACASAFVNKHIVLKVPSLKQLVILCNQRANDVVDVEVDERTISSAAMQFAGFIRNYAEHNIAALVFNALGQYAASDDISCVAQDADFIMPIVNLLEHYQWALGAIVESVDDADTQAQVYHFIITEQTHGQTLNVDALGTQPLPDDFKNHKFHYMYLPQDLEPEDALTRIASHKSIV